MELGANTLVDDVERALKLLKDEGFRAVYFDGQVLRLPEGRLKRIRAMCEDLGLRSFSAHTPYQLLPAPGRPVSEGVDRLKGALEKAAVLGVEMMTLHPGCLDEVRDGDVWKHVGKIGRERFWEQNVHVLGEVAEYAGSLGIKVTVENMLPEHMGDMFTRIEDVVALVSDVGSRNLGICLDSGHTFIAGLNPADGIRKAGKLLWETHFHDNFGKISGDYDLHRPPGIGRIDWLSVIGALREIGFRGPLVFELSLKGEERPEELYRLTYLSWKKYEEVWKKIYGRKDEGESQGAPFPLDRT